MECLKQLIADERGQSGSAVATGVLAITLVIIVFIYFTIRNSIPTGDFTADQNDTIEGIDTNVNTGLELYSLSIMISAAALILGLVMVFA